MTCSRPLWPQPRATNAATRRPSGIPSRARSARASSSCAPGREGLRVDPVVNRHDALGRRGVVLAHLLGHALRHAHQRGRPVQAHACPFGEALDGSQQPRVPTQQAGRTPRRGAVHLVAAVDRDGVDAVEHDRAGGLDDPAPAAAHRERAGHHEPRVAEQERAARAAHAVKAHAGAGRQLAGPGDDRDRVAHPSQPEHQLGQLALHAPDRAHVVGDDRDLTRLAVGQVFRGG